MKISELIAELSTIMQSQGDVDCYVYGSDYSNYYEPNVEFVEIYVRQWNEDKCYKECKTIKAVSINS